MELLDTVESCLAVAEQVSNQLTASLGKVASIEAPAVAKLRWVERQLASLMSKLSAARDDLGDGLSASDMGYADEQELKELVDDMAVQVAQLSALLHALSLAQVLSR